MIAAALIVFREIIEAGLIVGIVLAATRGIPGRGRVIATGIGAGVLGACLVAAFAGQIAGLFQGSGQELFQASILVSAVVMLAWHNIWMASHGREIAREMRELGAAVSTGARPLAALGLVVGLAVLREGSEVVLFLYGVAAADGSSVGAMMAGGAIGIAGGAAITVLTYRGLLAIPAGRLLSTTSWLITLLAAGMASQAVAFLQQAGFAGVLDQPLWNTAGLLAESSITGRMLHTLVGYTDQPSGLQLLVYLTTVLAIWGMARSMRRPVRSVPARA